MQNSFVNHPHGESVSQMGAQTARSDNASQTGAQTSRGENGYYTNAQTARGRNSSRRSDIPAPGGDDFKHSADRGKFPDSESGDNFAHGMGGDDFKHSADRGKFVRGESVDDFAHSTGGNDLEHGMGRDDFKHSTDRGKFPDGESGDNFAHGMGGGKFPDSESGDNFAHGMGRNNFAHGTGGGDLARGTDRDNFACDGTKRTIHNAPPSARCAAEAKRQNDYKNSLLKKQRKKRRKRKLRILAILCLFALLAGFLGFRKNAKTVVTAVAESRVRAMTTTCVNLAVYDTLAGISYTDLVTAEKNAAGEIVLLSANAEKLNRIARDAAFFSQKNLEESDFDSIKIPVGAFTGSEIFAGFGPDVTIKILPVGSASCAFFSDFSAVGINQTLHKIYLTVTADVDIVLPGYSLRVSVPTEIFVCESVLPGKVPNTYFDAELAGGFRF